MKVALMGSWNADSGASVHAELVGRELIKRGIDLEVFSFFRHSFHGTSLTKRIKEEEKYVKRCFTVYNALNPELNAEPLLNADFDIFMVEDLGMLPMKQLLEIYPQIKKKAKTVNVIHDGELSRKPEFFQFEWDHVVCFDERYYAFLKKAYPESKLSIIPYPSLPLDVGNKQEMRKKLNLPLEKKIVFLFGEVSKHAVNTAMVLDRLSEKYDVTLILLTVNEKIIEQYNRIKPKVKFNLEIIRKFPDTEELYEYLHAADCMIYNKPSSPVIVVSSTIYQCMGAGCPIITLESNFAEPFHDEIIKYRDFYELEESVLDVFEEGPKYQKLQQAIKKYLADKSSGKIAERFVELFERLLSK